MLTKAPKGTKDLLPEDAGKWQYIENKFQKICHSYGFGEMRTPIFEHTELFIRGVGDTTDIVQKEMYTWMQGKRSLTLRPEGTSPVMRSIIENKLYAQPLPLKIYYSIPCFRYEKPQSGRLRQFHQFGAETFGSDNMIADSEIISLAHEFLKELGIDELSLEINSVGCSKCKPTHRDALKLFLKNNYDDLCDTCKDRYERNPMRILDCKNPSCQSIVKDAPVMLEYLCEECENDFRELKENLDAGKIDYTVNPKIVRGLDYYTKTAFEFITDTIGAQGTVCGGGRYNKLSEEIGGPQLSGVGFGMGKERLLLVMEALGISKSSEDEKDISIAFMGNEAKKKAIQLASELREKDISVVLDVMERGLKGQLKLADRLNAKYALIIGDDELERKTAILRNMNDATQIDIPIETGIIADAVKGKF